MDFTQQTCIFFAVSMLRSLSNRNKKEISCEFMMLCFPLTLVKWNASELSPKLLNWHMCQFNSLIMLMIMSSGGVQPGDKFEVIELEDTYPDHEY